ncbi:ATP-binding cassette domain-containing protein [Rhodobacteraceae bacterium N5(2021)]|uniref:ATP-binding cassette domain-containing protein n=1 Tax=Gymnodinialimonas phycosphaerae TaxID=2841589 RepID=A0A975TZS7_9RHOB|nr:ATP-binding cassette domain-containing protein [Gymnodinialimonas phycosphaerae]MBY4893021.1 ATP-binding cassette domain-containing protein [Gymnodinialimonas phycosphaerae]
MVDEEAGATRNSRNRAKARIIAPVYPQLRLAGWMSLLAGALWPVQAAVIAWAVSGWAAGLPTMERAWPAAAVFVLCAILRAGLEHRSGALLHEAADQTIARERAVLITREARSPSDEGSASIAALVVQKLPLLHPWITRYHVAMTRASVLPVFFLVLAFSQSWVVGLTLLVAGPLIPVFMALVGMAAEEAARRQMDEIATMNDMVMDRLSAMLDIRLLGAADRAAEDFSDRAESLRSKTMAVLRIAFLSSTVLELFSALGVAMVAVFVGFTLLGEIDFGSWGGRLTLGQGLFLLLIAPEFFQPLRDLSAAWHDRAAGLAVVAELDALDGADRVAFVGDGLPCAALDGPMGVATCGVVVDLGRAPVHLPDIAIGKAQTLALTGPSGVGKSTALAAIAGLVPLHSGAINVCHHPLTAKTADAWRARIAMVPQRPHFPDETLGDWLDTRQTGADPWPALRLADADDIVKRLPEGLETRLGETGGGVSGGEARRLLLARAIHSGAELILADEPTADLDPETAGRIIAALHRMQAQGRSIIVATHDPQLAAAMDQQVEVGR